jgi:hypothetical protein
MGREELQFSQVVEREFRFLIDDYYYELVKSEATFVRYESKSYFMNIFHGRISYEIGVEIGDLTVGWEDYIYPHGILDYVLGPDHGITTYFQASSREAVENCVVKLAGIIRKHCMDVASGDRRAIDAIIEAQWKDSEEYTKQVVQEPVRREAEEAWRNKDYSKVVSLYGSIKEDLSEIELKKLEYAKKKS